MLWVQPKKNAVTKPKTTATREKNFIDEDAGVKETIARRSDTMDPFEAKGERTGGEELHFEKRGKRVKRAHTGLWLQANGLRLNTDIGSNGVARRWGGPKGRDTQKGDKKKWQKVPKGLVLTRGTSRLGILNLKRRHISHSRG